MRQIRPDRLQAGRGQPQRGRPRALVHLNVTVKVQARAKPRDLSVVREQAVGLDLGLKDLFCSSDGEQIEA